MLPLGRGHFWPQKHNLNKLGRGPQGDATNQILRHKALWFHTRCFHIFPYIRLYKTCDTGQGHFGLRGHYLNINLVEANR